MEGIQKLVIAKDKKVFFNGTEFEKAVWYIDEHHLLHLKGDGVATNFSMHKIIDKKILEKIEPQFIEVKIRKFFGKTWIKKYIPAFKRFTYKRRRPRKIITNNFIIIKEK